MIVANEVLADFKLNGTSISQFTLANSIVTLGTDAAFNLDLDVKASDVQTNHELEIQIARLLLNITCNITVPNLPEARTDLFMTMEGEFESSLKMDQDTFRSMLWANGTATLYSIARGKLEAMSSLVYHSGKITLPMINVVEFLKQKNEEGSQAISDHKSTT